MQSPRSAWRWLALPALLALTACANAPCRPTLSYTGDLSNAPIKYYDFHPGLTCAY